jgi:hypothetical protein
LLGSRSIVLEYKAIEFEAPGYFPVAREDLSKEFAEVFGAQTVIDVFPLSSGFDEGGDSQEAEVMAHGWLALLEAEAEIADMKFTMLSQMEEDAQSGFVRQQLEVLGEIPDDIFRQGFDLSICTVAGERGSGVLFRHDARLRGGSGERAYDG